MTTLVSDVCAEARGYLLGNLREQKNKLASGATTTSASDDDLTFTYDLGPIQAGAVLTIGLERMLVWQVNGSTVTVERGYDGTTRAAHTAGDLVAVNSRLDDFSIVRAINNELNTLSSPRNGIYRRRDLELTYDGAYGYDLDEIGTVIGDLIAVQAQRTGDLHWVPLAREQWRFDDAADTTDFPSGRSLVLGRGAGSSGKTIRVIYRSTFTPVTALSQDVNAVSFFPTSGNDILAMGAALQVAASRPMQRSDTQAQGAPRRAEETTTRDTLVAPADLQDRYRKRIADEAARLRAVELAA